MRPHAELRVSSILDAAPAVVWERVASLRGVNDELRPWFRMTAPRGVDEIDPATVPLGRRWFRSWILLFGVVPVDYDDLTVISIEPGHGFLERSSMLSQRVWQHERRLAPVDGGVRTVVTDSVAFEPRLPVGLGAQQALFTAVFRHRHRRLARWARGQS